MARNLSGVYSLPAGSIVSTGDTILPTQHNTPLNDIASDLNLPRPVVAGGTGADNAASALVNLGLTATAAEINTLDGITATTAELNILDGVTSTAAELNVLDGVTGLLGQGQTWQTPTRAVSTSYQNTTGRPIMVAISGRSSTGASRVFEVSADNSTFLIVGTTTDSTSGGTGGACFIVPPNWYYRTAGGGIDFLEWHELR